MPENQIIIIAEILCVLIHKRDRNGYTIAKYLRKKIKKMEKNNLIYF
jgi:hypothetical protein